MIMMSKVILMLEGKIRLRLFADIWTGVGSNVESQGEDEKTERQKDRTTNRRKDKKNERTIHGTQKASRRMNNKRLARTKRRKDRKAKS